MGHSGSQPPTTAPLVVRWGRVLIGPARAGAPVPASVELENAGSVAWRSAGASRILAAYHWLDQLGNPIVWDGLRTELPHAVEPGGRLSLELTVRAPVPPGSYRLALDLLDEGRLWFAEVGNPPCERDVEVLPRIERRLLAVSVRPGHASLEAETQSALEAQDEPLATGDEAAEAVAYLAAGCTPARDWVRRILDAHAEGFAAVGGSIAPAPGFLGRRGRGGPLAPWAPGGGRNPRFAGPLLCPSLLDGLDAQWETDGEGLPALRPPADEPWLYDGRIVVTAPRRSGRRPG